MKLVRVDKNREVEVPTSWSEGEAMITNALGAYYDGRGKNLADCRSQAASPLGFLARSSWPAIRRSASVFAATRLHSQRRWAR